MLIDRFLPEYDFAERHATTIAATPAQIDPHVRALDLSGSRIVRLLFRLRGMPRRAVRIDGLEQAGFRLLADAPAEEIVLGLVGRFWTPGGGLCRFDPDDFVGFEEPGWAKAVWGFRMEPQREGRTLLVTETRVRCTDAASRRRFRAYWTVIRPFSGLIRRVALREIKRQAEASGSMSRGN